MEQKFKVKYENEEFIVTHPKRGIFKIHRYFNNERHINTSYFRGFHICNPRDINTPFNPLAYHLENQSDKFPDSVEEFKKFLEDVKSIGLPNWHDKRRSTESYFLRYLSRISHFTPEFILKDFNKEYKKIKSMEKEFTMYSFLNKLDALAHIRGEFNLRKDILKIVKQRRVEISKTFYRYYYEDRDFLYDLILKFEQFDLWEDFNLQRNQYYPLERLCTDIDEILCYDFYQLIKNHGYDMRNVLEQFNNYFGIYENLGWREYTNLLHDYANMMYLMNVEKFKKFPKFLKSVHDITAREFQMYKKEYDEKVFKECVDKSLELKSDKFIVLTPSSTQDLYEEGKTLSHCVASYIDRVIQKRTQIVFFRYIESQPLITVEVKGKRIVQAKGFANRPLNKEEKTYLKEYCKRKDLVMSV